MNMVKEISISSERLRHYRSDPKRVGLDLRLTIILSDDAAYCTSCIANDVSHDWSTVLKETPYRVKDWSDGAQTSFRACEKHGSYVRWMSNVVGKFWLAAEDDKPSKIISESQALRLITNKAPENKGKDWNERLTLEQIFSARIQSVLDAAQEEVEASEDESPVDRQDDGAEV